MKGFQKFGYAALLAAFVFAGCEQAALGTQSGEAIALNAAKSVSKITIPPDGWQDFSPLPFPGITGITSVSGLATDGTYLVAAAYGGSTPYVSSYDTVSGLWSSPASLAPYGLTIKPGAIRYINGYFLVTGGSTTINGVYSPDGLKWQQTGSIGFGTKAGVYGPAQHLYVVAGQGGRAAYSPRLDDGFTVIPPNVTGWTNGTGPDVYINAAAYGDGRYVFGGGSGRIAYTSDITSTTPWYTASTPPFQPMDFVNAIAYGGVKTFVAAGNTGATQSMGIIVYSTDGGVNWDFANTSAEILNDGIFALTYGDGYYVAVNDSGFAAFSTDGMNWYDAPNPSIFGAHPRVDAAVFYAATNTFFAVGGDDNALKVMESN
jgi:hypothetical protein